MEFCEAKSICDLGEAGHSPRIKALLSQPWLNVRNMQYSLLNGWKVNGYEYLPQPYHGQKKKREAEIYIHTESDMEKWERKRKILQTTKSHCFKTEPHLISS